MPNVDSCAYSLCSFGRAGFTGMCVDGREFRGSAEISGADAHLNNIEYLEKYLKEYLSEEHEVDIAYVTIIPFKRELELVINNDSSEI